MGDLVIALAGNPNTGKSTLFNALTGLNQHTGNWPGKTVAIARGRFEHAGRTIELVDLPGTYSLLASSVEEQVARDFICFGDPAATILVADATCLERNLNLVLQVLEITPRVVLCVNLLDEAERKGIAVDTTKLAAKLGVPVVPIVAREGRGLAELKERLIEVATKSGEKAAYQPVYPEQIERAAKELVPQIADMLPAELNPTWIALRMLEGDESILTHLPQLAPVFAEVQASTRGQVDALRDQIVTAIYRQAEAIAAAVVSRPARQRTDWDRKIDDLLTSKLFGYPLMLALLAGVFWLTISGANYPSQALAALFFSIEDRLTQLFLLAGAPEWLHGFVVLGVYRSLAWVVSVMLPPMAIFFPLFTLLEDLGYLPRIAFNLDGLFQRAGTHGKQALTMAMGFGCNAAGVVAARIIDSPRERLIAMVTNNFVPCNGRFPLLITLASLFFGQGALMAGGLVAAGMVVGLVLLGITITLLISWLLSKTLLRGVPSAFMLELPPYRKPQIGRIIVRSLFDRTLFVLKRAVMVAAPAGGVIWLLANLTVGGQSLITHLAGRLDPFSRAIGLDGYILLAFILGLPANEIVIPILLMSYLGAGAMLELDSLSALHTLLVGRGWTWLTALNTMLFSLLHFPCATTLLVMRKESGGLRWPLLAVVITTGTAILVCWVIAQGARLVGLV